METVHPSLKKQIVEGKDVNLAALLIPFYSGQHSDIHDPRLNNSLTLAQFIQAFAIYTAGNHVTANVSIYTKM